MFDLCMCEKLRDKDTVMGILYFVFGEHFFTETHVNSTCRVCDAPDTQVSDV